MRERAVAARARPNTVLAVGYDLKVFFTLVPKEPGEPGAIRAGTLHPDPGYWPETRKPLEQLAVTLPSITTR